MRVSRKKFLLLVLPILIVVAPCAFCWWIVFGNNLVFRTRLPIYPNANQISDVYGYYGAGKGVQRIYFWSSSSVDEIVSYYEGFTYPFVEDSNDPGVYRTAFNPSGAPLPIRMNLVTKP
jgi:hypothetical protein